ncbi:MAG: terminase small subunit [Ruminococcus sp.]|nr:terminase small subunit [Ruminococcus sp.]MBP3798495.1 terminase small subunit [Ruminococcus sp.]MBQ1432431.1 terminase small subunit [Ruminococcus sp.]
MELNKRLFAKVFVRTRNGSETAVRLGAQPENAKLIEAELLADPNVKKAIRKLDKEDVQTLCYVKTGLSRLAFGSINEAAALVFADEVSRDEILKADLFNVSELKRIKGGGVEMKFFDRQKALEKLVELDPDLREVSAAQEFLNAVYGSDDETGGDME